MKKSIFIILIMLSFSCTKEDDKQVTERQFFEKTETPTDIVGEKNDKQTGSLKYPYHSLKEGLFLRVFAHAYNGGDARINLKVYYPGKTEQYADTTRWYVRDFPIRKDVKKIEIDIHNVSKIPEGLRIVYKLHTLDTIYFKYKRNYTFFKRTDYFR